ncbi:MAG: SCP2 sterol-binding domain-containing protein [Candidatus Caldarchaeum sp.]|nr:SCP2 sterol-binding domain-containing protein [Candidatus Caldarchaeum sp.]MDW8434789.1 SCP2 sterol-binding domain-containing protein [Candidatus Caldarchaeum sp.]
MSSPEKKFVFGSREWFEYFVKVLNEDPEYNAAAKDWEDPITLLLTNLPPAVKEFFGAEQTGAWLDLYHGRCRQFEIVKTADEKPAPIIISGSYENMKKVALGRVSPTVAVMTGQLKVKGNMAKLLSNAAAAAAFVNAIKKVPTEFLA